MQALTSGDTAGSLCLIRRSKLLDPRVPTVDDIEVAGSIEGNVSGITELAGGSSWGSTLGEELAPGGEHVDAR